MKLKFVTANFLNNSLCAVVIGTGIFEYSANTFFNTYIKNYKEAYKNGKPIELSKNLQKRYADVVKDLKFTEFQKAFSVPFVVEGLKPVNIGCLNTRSGCYIGLPINFDYKSVEDVENSDFEEYIQLFNSNYEYKKQYMETLILSDSAKKFAIAKEIVLTDNFQLFIKSIISSLTLIPVYALGEYIMKLISGNPIKLRGLVLFILCNIGIILCFFLRNCVKNFFLHDADSIVCKINSEYIKGGLEYYEKEIQRNKILRNILPFGHEIYSEKGDEKKFFSELPLSFRIKTLEHYLKKKNEDNLEIL